MKILLGVPEYPPYNVGGGGEVFKNLAENYKKLGHDVVVMYGYYPTKSWWEDIREYTDENGIKFYQIPEIPYPKSIPFLRTAMPCNFKAYRELKWIIKEEKPDIVHLHGYGLIFINLLSIILYKLEIKYIYTLHGAPVSPSKIGGFIYIIYDFYNKFIGQKTLKRAYKITSVSEYSRTFSEFSHYKNNIIVINNGFDYNKYKSNNKEKNIYERFLNKDRKAIIFLSLGRIEWIKGYQYLIEIIPDLMKYGFDIKYFIAGRDNGDKNHLDEMIYKYNLKDKIFFLGQLDFNEKVNALSNCDYVIIPSIVENFPAVPLEAMAMGKIPIVNNAGGMPEIIQDGYNGISVNVKNKDMFSNKVIELLNNESLQRKIKLNLNKLYKYNWEKISREYINLMQEYEK